MNELFSIIDILNSSIKNIHNKINMLPESESWEGRTSTLIVTDECNLRCTYCYCTKNNKAMSWETAKSYIDLVFEDSMSSIDLPREKQLASEHRKIFEFIGGEPLLEADLMFQCIDYILDRLKKLPPAHPWTREDWPCPCGKDHAKGLKFMISTNGILLNDPSIQARLLALPNEYFHIGMTIDGTKEMHDLCRITPDNLGSHDDVMRAWRWLSRHYPHSLKDTKSTLAHENLDYLAEIVKYCYDLGMSYLAQNCVFENVWHRGDQHRLYKQLIKAADYLLDKKRYERMNVRWFNPEIFTRSARDTGKWCGAGTYMNSCDHQGNIYPCLRFKQLKEMPPYVMGSVQTGILRTQAATDEFNSIDINAIYNPRQVEITGLKCAECPISALCSDCQAYAYDCFGTLEAKSPFICPMHKAAAVANIYFFSKLLENPLDADYLELLLSDWTKTDYFSTDGGFEK